MMPWEINKGVSSDAPSSVIDTEVKEESTPSIYLPFNKKKTCIFLKEVLK